MRNAVTFQPDLPPPYVGRIRALRMGSNYDFADRFRGHTILDAKFSQGLSVFGASTKEDLDVSRPGAHSDFHKLTFNVSRRQELERLLPNLGIFTALSAQTSFGEPLLSAEQFGLGGATYGRGYEPSEITGDKGIAGKVELQYNQQLIPISSAFQCYGFYDVGAVGAVGNVGNVLAAAGVPRTQSLASADGGVRSELQLGFSGLLEVAKQLPKAVETEFIRGSSDPKRPHAYFSITERF